MHGRDERPRELQMIRGREWDSERGDPGKISEKLGNFREIAEMCKTIERKFRL